MKYLVYKINYDMIPKGKDMASNDTKIALLEQSVGHINESLQRIEKRLEQIEQGMNKRFDLIENRLWYLVFWVIASFVGILSLVTKSQHWI